MRRRAALQPDLDVPLLKVQTCMSSNVCCCGVAECIMIHICLAQSSPHCLWQFAGRCTAAIVLAGLELGINQHALWGWHRRLRFMRTAQVW